MRKTEIIKKVVSVEDLFNFNNVVIDGKLETIDKKAIKRGFTGYTYKGNPHHKGLKVLVFKVPTRYGYRYE